MELYMRDSVECVAALLGNPVFAEVSKYAFEEGFTEDAQGNSSRAYNEMWSGNWWRDVEVRETELNC
jgi:hypothetical protein